MSVIQKIFKFILPEKLFQRIKKESETWFFECACGSRTSVWEAGGVRAWATNKMALGYCSKCKRYKRLRLVKSDGVNAVDTVNSSKI